MSPARCWTSLAKRFRLFTERHDEALSGKTNSAPRPEPHCSAGPEPLLGCCVNKEFNSAAYVPSTSKQSTWPMQVSLCITVPLGWSDSRTLFHSLPLSSQNWRCITERGKHRKKHSKKIFGLIIQLYPQARPVFSKRSGKK